MIESGDVVSVVPYDVGIMVQQTSYLKLALRTQLSMLSINYHNRYFSPVTNSANGEVDASTIFHYRQEGDIVWATYSGGDVLFGTLVATVNAGGVLDMCYQHVNRNGKLMTGRCRSNPEVLPDGRLRLHEQWRWTSGDMSEGSSIMEEILDGDMQS